MRKTLMLTAGLLLPLWASAQAALQAPVIPPTLAEIRKGMGIPSHGDLRGQQDIIGFASTAEQMAKVWELSGAAPAPEALGPRPEPGVAGVICPHDDYLYAGRVYRELLPLVSAKTIVLIGVFHRYRLFGAKDALVYDAYRAWRTPDGELPVSSLRDELLAHLPPGDVIQDAAMQDSEHSVEAIAYWLKHLRPDVEIVSILVPSASFPRFQELAGHLGGALAGAMRRRGWSLGRDLAIVISSDAIHYGADFHYTPYGEGGTQAFLKATARDRELLRGPLAGPLSADKARAFFSACVQPERPDVYTMPWCGRFSVPLGLLLLGETARALGGAAPVGLPVAYGASVDTPELPVKALGMGRTAPASLYHFVGFPAVAYAPGK